MTDGTTERGERWFDRLFTTHATAVHRFVARRADRSDVDDLTADVLTIAWRRRDDIPDGAELPWLYRTAGFVVANHHRKKRPTPFSVVPDESDPQTPQWSDAGDDLRQVLEQLSPRDQKILLLSAWDGLSGDDLAAVLDISRGGAAAALSRARTRLQMAWARVDAAG